MNTSTPSPNRLIEPFVGRKPELRQLEEHLSQAVAGRGHVVLVSGEAGIGKTSLVERFLAAAETRHPQLSVATGRCSERFGGGEGYLPFIGALGALLAGEEEKSARDKVLEVVLETAPSWLSAIPAVGSALKASFETAQAVRDRFGSESSQLSTPDNEHVLQEYAGVLTRLSEQNPILLFIDDLQWSDAASVDLLVHLSRRVGGNRILILGTYRPSDVRVGRDGQPHPLREAVLEMNRYRACHEMALDRLSREECEALVGAEYPAHRFPSSLLNLLFEHSEGNALFITEMLRLLRETGLIERRRETWTLVRSIDDVPLPQSVESLVDMRIDRLQADLQRALRYASVEGERFLSTILAQVLDLDELELEERLGILEEIHQLIAAEGELEIGWELATVYQFTHILFQDVLYERLRPKERVLLHRRTGLALEALYGEASDEIASELALHFAEGRAFDKALQYSLLAGQAAQRLYAAREAIGHYQRAQRLLERVDGHEPAQQLAIEQGLGDMRALIADHDAALDHYRRARELLGDAPGTSDRLAALSRKTAMLYERKGEYETAFRWLRRGLESLSEHSLREGARIRLAGAGIYTRQGKHQKALRWCQSALELAKKADSRAELAHASYLLGTIQWHRGRIGDMISYADRSLALYEKLRDLQGQAKTLHNLGIAHTEGGDWSAALRNFRHAIELEQKLGDVHSVAKTTNSLGVLMLRRGEAAAAERAYRRCLEIWTGIGFPIGVALAYSNLGEVAIECQEWEIAAGHLSRSEDTLHEIGSELFLPEVYRRQALVLLHTGRSADARELVHRSLSLADKLDMTLEKGISLRVHGQVEIARGEWKAAEEALRQSLAILRQHGNEYQTGEALYQLGRLYRADRSEDGQGQIARAEMVLGRAKEIFKRLGARRALEKVEEEIG